ncbi:MAG: hypothetical protein RL204_892 [Bacteroidota bacterium]|jgi:hypothetical protein
MKKSLALLALLSISFCSIAQDIIRFHQNGNMSVYNLFENDSIYFDESHTNMFFDNNGTINSFITADVDSITFLHDALTSIFINYNGDAVEVTNPLEGQGVAVSVSGGFVTVTSTSLLSNLNFILSGSTTNGGFKIYSDNPYNLLLNNVSLLNPVGPAINSQSERQVNIVLVEGTSNSLTDGSTYATAPVTGGTQEDQKATLFAEGDIDIMGGGYLTVHGFGSDAHAIASDSDLEIKHGNVNVVGAVKDGIHASDHLDIKGGITNVVASDDGVSAGGIFEIECGQLLITSSVTDTKALTSDTLIVISGGFLTVINSGTQSKGVSSSGDIQITGGSTTISDSGAAVLVALGSGMDAKHSACLTADGDIEISGGQTIIQATGVGGRAIKTDLNFEMTGGTISASCSGNGATYNNSTGTLDAYHSTCLRTNGDVNIVGGNFTAGASGSGGKGIESDGDITIGNGTSNPVVSVTTTGTNITITAGGGGGPGGGSSGNYDEAKAIKTDLIFTMNSGALSIDSNDDGVKALGGFVLNNGEIVISDSKEGVEAPFITINNGTIHVNSTDDSLNGTHGTGGESDDGSLVLINDGYVHLSGSAGDPMDSNGDVTINGGLILVHGPQSSPEVGMDYNGTGLVNGGIVIISGTNSNMTQGFNTTSTQRSLIMKSTTSLAANTIIHLEDSNGNELFSFKPIRSYYSVVFSSPLLTNGTTYRLYSSGSHTGTVTDGYITGGAYTAGTLEQTFTISSMVTNVSY